ncbi:hypothetical protein, partial [Streptomyces thermospinosisporus]|uniref:hypothetical protein n=1 Tax=Streptomyces thermospinosisporus TaxID=161482 RepID=UPI0031DAB1DC
AAQEAAPRTVFALPPADADQGQQAAQAQQGSPAGQAEAVGQAAAPGPVPVPAQGAAGNAPLDENRHDAAPHDQSADHTPPQPHPTDAPTGRRRRVAEPQPVPNGGVPAQEQGPGHAGQAQGAPAGQQPVAAGQQPVAAG